MNVEEHLGLARHIANRYRSDDPDGVAGEAVLALVVAGRTFDETRGTFASFAGVVIRRRLFEHVVKERSRKEAPLMLTDDDGNEHERPEATHTPDPGADVLAGQLRAVVRLLAPRERAVIVGRYWRGMTREAIADALGLSRQRVAQLEAAALRKLARLLQAPRVRRHSIGTCQNADI